MSRYRRRSGRLSRRDVARLALIALICLSALASTSCGFGAFLFDLVTPDPVPLLPTGQELVCFVDVRPRGMAGVSPTPLSNADPRALEENGSPRRPYRESVDCAPGFAFPTRGEAEDDWRLFSSRLVVEAVDGGDPLFAFEGPDGQVVEWCEVPATLRCEPREDLLDCGGEGLPLEPLSNPPLPVCELVQDPFEVLCDGLPCAVIDFGQVAAGVDPASAPRREVTVRNAGEAGDVDLFVDYDGTLLPTDGVDGLAEFAVLGNTCRGEEDDALGLAPGEACGFEVRFAPTELGVHGARLPLTYSYRNDLGLVENGRDLEVRGAGVRPPGPCIDVTCDLGTCDQIDFGAVDLGLASSPRTVTVANCGTVGSPEVRLAAAASLSGTGEFVAAAGACFTPGGLGLAAGEACGFEVTFEPTVEGGQAGTLEIPYTFEGDATPRSRPIALAGRGDGRAITVSPPADICVSEIVAGGCTQPFGVVIANAGSADLTATCAGYNLATTGGQCPGFVFDGGFQIASPTGQTVPFVVPPGGQEGVGVRWCGDPAVEESATLAIRSDDLTLPEVALSIERRITCP